MANITTLLGTDSISSSRPTINQNFASIQDELAEIALLLDVTEETIVINGKITAGSVRVNNGSIDTFLVNNSSIVANLPVIFNADITLNAALIQNIEVGVNLLPVDNSYGSATYVLNGSQFQNDILLSSALEGQTLTFIVEEEEVTFNTANINGVTQLIVPVNGSVTFTRVGIAFYLVSSTFNATVVY